MNSIHPKLEEQKAEAEKELGEKRQALRDFSAKVSETQVRIIELNGELKGIEKMLKALEKEQNQNGS